MKHVLICLLAVCFLCSCEAEQESISHAEISTQNETSVLTESLEETEIQCDHTYGDEPVEIVGNLYIFECTECGERKVVPQGTMIGGEE